MLSWHVHPGLTSLLLLVLEHCWPLTCFMLEEAHCLLNVQHWMPSPTKIGPAQVLRLGDRVPSLQLLVHLQQKDDLSIVGTAWLSLLASPGLIIHEPEEPLQAYVVLHCSRWGLVVWPVAVVKKDELNHKYFILVERASISFKFTFHQDG